MPHSKQLLMISLAMILVFLSEPAFADPEPNSNDYELVILDKHYDPFFFNYKGKLVNEERPNDDNLFMYEYEGVWYSEDDQKIYSASFIFRKSNQSMCLTEYDSGNRVFYYNLATRPAYGKRLDGVCAWLNSGNDPNSIDSMYMVITKGDIKGMIIESGK